MISLWGGGGWGCLERMVTTELLGMQEAGLHYFLSRGGRKWLRGMVERGDVGF